MRKENTTIDGKKVAVYIQDYLQSPIILSSDVSDAAEKIIKECEVLGCPNFHFVSITGLRWDEELSPWAHHPIVAKNDHFTGEADHYLEVLEKEIVPYVKMLIPGEQSQILHGYSMGGLFALYAAHHSTSFDAYAAPSGSVWYPDFVRYAEEHGFRKKPKAIYLSLGDRESKSRNPYLSQTEGNMQKLMDHYQNQKIQSVFELNPGNHFKDVSHRIAKGIDWILKNTEEREKTNGSN